MGLALGDVLHPQTSEVSTSAANQSVESDSGLGTMQRLDCLIFATLLIMDADTILRLLGQRDPTRAIRRIFHRASMHVERRVSAG